MLLVPENCEEALAINAKSRIAPIGWLQLPHPGLCCIQSTGEHCIASMLRTMTKPGLPQPASAIQRADLSFLSFSASLRSQSGKS